MDSILFTDLDGTLIFSASRKTAGDVVVEYKDGAEISCISAFQCKALPQLRNVVPVTTRSIEQYRRICFPEGFAPHYAITDNGGNLLVDGVPDREWAEHSAAIAAECADELSRAREVLERDLLRSFEIRTVDGLFLFTKSRVPEQTLSALGTGRDTEAFSTGEKVYVLPKKLSKGAAALRLAERIGFSGRIIAAGDSRMDIPLLNIADLALIADSAPAEEVTAAEKLVSPREGFSDFVTRKALELLCADL